MERSISDDGDLCRQLAELDTTSDIDTTLLSDGAVAVTVTLHRDAPESTIEVEDGEVTDYEIYVGPYRPYDRICLHGALAEDSRDRHAGCPLSKRGV